MAVKVKRKFLRKNVKYFNLKMTKLKHVLYLESDIYRKVHIALLAIMQLRTAAVRLHFQTRFSLSLTAKCNIREQFRENLIKISEYISSKALAIGACTAQT